MELVHLLSVHSVKTLIIKKPSLLHSGHIHNRDRLTHILVASLLHSRLHSPVWQSWQVPTFRDNPLEDVRIKYQTFEFEDTDIHVRTLRDLQQFSDVENKASNLGISSAQWPLFGVIWASGELLARLMYDYEIDGERILEVGCGIGLASLVLDFRLADITATDYHPEAEEFLLQNTKLNGLRTIPFVRTGWNDSISDLGTFDIIIGSDLLYEAGHSDLLAAFIDQHAKRHCIVILVDPGRSHASRFSKNMIQLGYSYSQSLPEIIDELRQSTRGRAKFQVLTYVR